MGPNIFWQDVQLSLKLLLSFKSNKLAENQLEIEFSKKFGPAISFNSGRSAMLAILKSLNLHSADEVAIQAYTCVAVPDVVLWAGLKPLYIDINPNTFNMDPVDLQEKITKKTKVLIIQHTFGIPADIEKLLKIARKNKLFVIEDCAHALGVRYKDKYLGTFGDAAFFSFGRDKMISSVFGGMATTSNKKLEQQIRDFQLQLAYPTPAWTFQQLVYSPVVYLIIKTYWLGIGKLVHYLANKLGILSKAVADAEKKAQQPNYFPKKMPAVLCELALSQLNRLEYFNSLRLYYANKYLHALKKLSFKHPPQNLPLLRYVIRLDQPNELKSFVKKYGIYLDTWYSLPIDPKGTDNAAIGYILSSCPKAEKTAQESLNLPTNPNLSSQDINYVIQMVSKYYAKS